MISYNPEKKIIRTCTAPFEFTNDKGELEVTDLTIQYYGISTKKLKEMRAATAKHFKDAPDEPLWNSELLVQRIHALPDLVDKNKKPYAITVDFLDAMDLKNLDAIRLAIEEDGRPKAPPEK